MKREFIIDFVKISLIPLLWAFKKLGSIVHRNPVKIIFCAWFGQKFDDNSKALFEYTIKNRKDINAIWITGSKEVLEELIKLNYPVCYTWSLKAICYHLTSKYVVFCTSSHDGSSSIMHPLLSGATFINLWHGIPLKKIGKDDNIDEMKFEKMLDRKNVFLRIFLKKYYNIKASIAQNVYVFSSSEAISKIYEGVFGLSSDRILCLGQARNDYFFGNHPNEIRERFAGKKIVLYMPTHRSEGKTIMDFHNLLDLDAINKLCVANNFILLIKKHFFHKADPIVMNNEYSNIIELTHENVKAQELLDASDILITDYSSAYIDYLLLNRPIVFYAYDLQKYLEEDRELYLEYNQENIPGKICTNMKELKEELERLFQGKDFNESLRNKIKNYYYSSENQKAVAAKQIDKILSIG